MAVNFRLIFKKLDSLSPSSVGFSLLRLATYIIYNPQGREIEWRRTNILLSLKEFFSLVFFFVFFVFFLFFPQYFLNQVCSILGKWILAAFYFRRQTSYRRLIIGTQTRELCMKYLFKLHFTSQLRQIWHRITIAHITPLGHTMPIIKLSVCIQ